MRSLLLNGTLFLSMGVFMGCGITPQIKSANPSMQMPETLEYRESENTIFNINYTCFKLAEKTKAAFDAYRKSENKKGPELFMGSIHCDAGPQGRKAFVTLILSKNENDSSEVMTGPSIFAVTSDRAQTFKWSTWELGRFPPGL